MNGLDQDFAEFIRLFNTHSHIDLNQYKEAQMKRRIMSFRDKYEFKTFVTMFNEMRKNQVLYGDFLDKMTINVTEFFRNPNMWTILETSILPSILKNSRSPKFWSAACSSGEEPYTLSMVLSKYLPSSQINITATDIDSVILDKARTGKYAIGSVKNVPEALLKKYFTKNELEYIIADEVKKTVNFKKHNLLHDNFDKDYDLVICRNVVIYFTDEAKHLLYKKFANSLRSGGYFFIGSTEQIFTPQAYGLEPVGTFLYKKV